MPVNRQFDVVLNGRGYMLARGQFKGRAWRRTGRPNAVQPFVTDADAQRNALPPELDFIATYDDFSGGFGDAYRNPSRPNRYHWSENFDARFPRQLVHAQGPRTLRGAYNVSPSGGNVDDLDTQGQWVLQVPPVDVGAGAYTKFARPTTGRGSVIVTGYGSYLETYTPTGLPATGSEFDRVDEASGILGFGVHRLAYRPAVFGSYAWFGKLQSNNGFFRRDMTGVAGLSWTRGPLVGQVFAVAGQRLWRAYAPDITSHVKYLQSCDVGSDPLATANWSATLTIGDAQTDVQDMIALDDQLYLSAANGLYAGDYSGTFVNVLGDGRGQAHPDNGRHVTVHDGGIVYPYTGGLLWYQPSLDTARVEDIGPAFTSQRSPVRGRFRSVASFGGWLHVALYTGSQTHLLSGRDRGTGEYDWHTMQRMPHPTAIGHVAVDTISTPSGNGNAASGNLVLPPRMWALSDPSIEASVPVTTVASLHNYWWPIPAGDSNPLGAPNFSANYCGSARFDFGRDNRGAPETLKVLRRTEINTDASTFLSGSRYADVYYTLDGGARTLLGRAQSSPKAILYYPAGNGSFVTCYDFEISLESFTGSLNQTPIYRSVVTHGAFLAAGADEITAVLDMATNRADRSGAQMRTAAAQLNELRALEGAAPVVLIDLSGAMNWVTVQRGVEETETYQEGEDDPEIAATVRLSVLTFSGSTTG